ncbi:DNA replication terminus site-binding protein [Martelella alba]|uniref:DNA replication terminus site-binding protein n=1 Tax=Martelella alba TaxID=2590451 RepID=A0ABY2SLE7_9HYPH|nr:DNA replication terminus site-binding protein [Martelella alba]TKI05676.1 DNA replication terminus site-binding protein [Martelella alba]
MRHLDVIARLNDSFTTMQARLTELRALLEQTPLLIGRVFELPETEKGREHDAVTTIPVLQHLGADALARGLNHFQRLFIFHQNQNSSAKAAIRLPGALCFDVEPASLERISAVVNEINRVKAEFNRIITVEAALPPAQRFEFVHNQLRGLKTLSAYRGLQIIIDPWSVRFGWANKHIIKNLTRADVLSMLKKSLEAGRAVPPYDKTQWREKILQEWDVIGKLPPDIPLKIKRPVKVQPIARVWYQERQRQIQYACPSPLLVFSLRRDGAPLPQVGELTDYRQESVRHKYKPSALPAHLIIERLHLYVAE